MRRGPDLGFGIIKIFLDELEVLSENQADIGEFQGTQMMLFIFFQFAQ